jgi:hypothetical protein
VEDCQSHVHEFKMAGFNGCIGSSDATHIAVGKCSYRLRNSHLGAKQHLTTRSFNLTCHHQRKILSVTVGMPGRWNDKTVVLFDNFVRGIYEGDYLLLLVFFAIISCVFLMLLMFIAVALGNVVPDFTFELLENNPGTGRVTRRRYCGPWLIVDNGYLKWSTTIPPFKLSTMEKERRWSQWLESLGKDVECTFGILKGRWRILKIGIRLGGVEVADNIFKTLMC